MRPWRVADGAEVVRRRRPARAPPSRRRADLTAAPGRDRSRRRRSARAEEIVGRGRGERRRRRRRRARGRAPAARARPGPARPAAAAPRPAPAGIQVTSIRRANRWMERDQRRPESQREDQAAGRVHRVEAQALPDVDPQLAEAVIAEGDPVADVLHRGEGKARRAADERQRPAPDRPRVAATGARAHPPGQHRAEHPGGAPRRHLPRGPRSLAEEEVGGQPGERPDREARRPAERVARRSARCRSSA